MVSCSFRDLKGEPKKSKEGVIILSWRIPFLTVDVSHSSFLAPGSNQNCSHCNKLGSILFLHRQQPIFLLATRHQTREVGWRWRAACLHYGLQLAPQQFVLGNFLLWFLAALKYSRQCRFRTPLVMFNAPYTVGTCTRTHQTPLPFPHSTTALPPDPPFNSQFPPRRQLGRNSAENDSL